jgi:putative transposase
LRRPIEPKQYTSFDYTQVLDDHEVLASIGTVGDALDNALAESFVDSYKTELIADRVWRTRVQLELATVQWVAWFNHQRLHEALGDIPPVEFEQLHAAATDAFADNLSVTEISPSGSERLTTRRFTTGRAENHPDERDPAKTAPSLVVNESYQLVSVTLGSGHHQPMETN